MGWGRGRGGKSLIRLSWFWVRILEYYETDSRTRSGYSLDTEFGHDILLSDAINFGTSENPKAISLKHNLSTLPISLLSIIQNQFSQLT